MRKLCVGHFELVSESACRQIEETNMNKKNISFKNGILFLLSLLFIQFSFAQNQLQTGNWKGQLQLNDSINLDFYFAVKIVNKKFSLEIINADERILVDEISFKADSVFIKMPVFDSEFKCKIFLDSALTGVWINHSRKENNTIPFSAERFFGPNHEVAYFLDGGLTGQWESTFSPQSKDSSKAIAIIGGTAKYIEGTFLTETGDYRFLYGDFLSRYFHLSTFDGSHAFVFTGEVKGDSIINGHFYSGSHWHEPWVAVRNDMFQLPNPDSLTYLKPGFSKIYFSFKNTEGKTVSLSDEKYKNKVVIIQIMGSWCPNCMDETAFLAPLYEKNKSKGLEIVALAFEKTDDNIKAINNVSRLKKRYNANYEFLITGKSGKDMASEALPMLNGIMAFPTTIFIDKKGIVRKIYTGFTGPGTGMYYDIFVDNANLFLEKLLNEE